MGEQSVSPIIYMLPQIRLWGGPWPGIDRSRRLSLSNAIIVPGLCALSHLAP